MNTLMIVVVVLVVFCYFGGKYCPLVLKKNKEILLGLAGGLVLCSFFGLRLEGFKMVPACCGEISSAELDRLGCRTNSPEQTASAASYCKNLGGATVVSMRSAAGVGPELTDEQKYQCEQTSQMCDLSINDSGRIFYENVCGACP